MNGQPKIFEYTAFLVLVEDCSGYSLNGITGSEAVAQIAAQAKAEISLCRFLHQF